MLSKPSFGGIYMNLGALISASILFVLGFALRSGKASWLIAGYNTMSKYEKEKYNEKALCLFVSNILLICAAIEIVEARAQYLNNVTLVVVGFVLIGVLAIGSVIYVNTGNRFKNME